MAKEILKSRFDPKTGVVVFIMEEREEKKAETEAVVKISNGGKITEIMAFRTEKAAVEFLLESGFKVTIKDGIFKDRFHREANLSIIEKTHF